MSHSENTVRSKVKHVCPVHGPTTWETCIQCGAEAALARRLLKERQAKKDRTESRLANDEVEG